MPLQGGVNEYQTSPVIVRQVGSGSGPVVAPTFVPSDRDARNRDRGRAVVVRNLPPEGRGDQQDRAQAEGGEVVLHERGIVQPRRRPKRNSGFRSTRIDAVVFGA